MLIQQEAHAFAFGIRCWAQRLKDVAHDLTQATNPTTLQGFFAVMRCSGLFHEGSVLAYVFDLRDSARGATIGLESLFGYQGYGSSVAVSPIFHVLANNIWGSEYGILQRLASWNEDEITRGFTFGINNYGNPDDGTHPFRANNPDIGLPDRFFANHFWTALSSDLAGNGQYIRFEATTQPFALMESVYAGDRNEAQQFASDQVSSANVLMARSLDAVSARRVIYKVEFVRFTGDDTDNPELVVSFKAPRTTTMTFGDIVESVFGIYSGFAVTGADVRTMFSDTDVVRIRLGDLDDDVRSQGFRAGELIIDAAAGNDQIYITRNDALGPDAARPHHLTISAGSGNDTMHVDAASRVEVFAGVGDDFIGIGYDSAAPSVATTLLHGGIGNDTIDGALLGQNRILGGTGRDELYGGSRRDWIDGGDGHDMIWAGSGHDVVYGGRGDDLIYGESGSDRLYAGSGHDVVYDSGGNNLLVGGSGNDTIVAGNGNDTLVGGRGNDLLAAAGGADVFVFGALFGTDRVEDASAEDRLLIDPGLWSGSAAELAATAVAVGPNPGLALTFTDGSVLSVYGITDRALLASIIEFGSFDL